MSDPLTRLGTVANLRDIGGHRTENGSLVGTGRVYRSAALTGLDPASSDDFRSLGIRTIFDLRRNAERETLPTPWQDLGCADYRCRDYAHSDADLTFPRGAALTAGRARDLMIEMYGGLPYVQAAAHAELFRAIGQRRVPILIHCAAGKDRTGAAAALILAALDVPRAAIVEDYLATSRYDLNTVPHLRGARALSPERAVARAPLFAVDEDYLESLFGGIERRSGSIDAYLRDTLSLTEADVAAFRQEMLDCS